MTGGLGEAAENEALGGIMNLQAGAVMAGQMIGEAFRNASEVIVDAVNKASQFEETHSKFLTVFSSIESAAQAMATELKNGYGMSAMEAEKLLAATGDLLVGFQFSEDSALDLSMEVQKLSADLASFQNLQGGAAHASEIITKAMLGERDALVSLGVKISETDLKQKALALGYKVGKDGLDKQTQAQVTLKLIMEQSAKAMGDFERTEDSFANQQKILNAHLEDMKVELGQKLMPIFGGIISRINETFGEEKSLNTVTGTLISTYIKYKDVVDELAKSHGKLTESQKTTLEATKYLLEGQLENALVDFKAMYEKTYSEIAKVQVPYDPRQGYGVYELSGKPDAVFDKAKKYFEAYQKKLVDMKKQYDKGVKDISTQFVFDNMTYQVLAEKTFSDKPGFKFKNFYDMSMKNMTAMKVKMGENESKMLGDLNQFYTQFAVAIKDGMFTIDAISEQLGPMAGKEEFLKKLQDTVKNLKDTKGTTPPKTTYPTDDNKGKTPEEMELERLKAQYEYLKTQNVWNIELIQNLKDQEAVLLKIRAGLTVDTTEYYKNEQAILENKEKQAKLEAEIGKTAESLLNIEGRIIERVSDHKGMIRTVNDEQAVTLEQVEELLGKVKSLTELFGAEVPEGVSKVASGIAQTGEILSVILTMLKVEGAAALGPIGAIIAIVLELGGALIAALTPPLKMSSGWESVVAQVEKLNAITERYNTILGAVADTLALIQRIHSNDGETTKNELEAEQVQLEANLEIMQTDVEETVAGLNTILAGLGLNQVEINTDGIVQNLNDVDAAIDNLAEKKKSVTDISNLMSGVDVDQGIFNSWVRDEDRENFKKAVSQARDWGFITQDDWNVMMSEMTGGRMKEAMDMFNERMDAAGTSIDSLIDQFGALKDASGEISDAIATLEQYGEDISTYDPQTALNVLDARMTLLQAQEASLEEGSDAYLANHQAQLENIAAQIEATRELLALAEEGSLDWIGLQTEIANLEAERLDMNKSISEEIQNQITLTEELRKLIDGASFDTENLYQIRRAMTEYEQRGYNQAQAAAELAQLGVREQLIGSTRNVYGGIHLTFNEAFGEDMDAPAVLNKTNNL
jgi:hypothetical protein